MQENPDIYTLWNVRKETILLIKKEKYVFIDINLFIFCNVFTIFLKCRPDQLDDYVAKELLLTEQCIRVNVKSYNSWFHRSWLLDVGTNIDFAAEFSLCDKCLELDERNCKYFSFKKLDFSHF